MRNLMHDVEFQEAFKRLQTDIHDNAREKGFYDSFQAKDEHIATRLALIHSEVSEALEALRKGVDLPDEFAAELADVVIRTMDLAEACGLDLGRAITDKHAANTKREHMHNKRF